MSLLNAMRKPKKRPMSGTPVPLADVTKTTATTNDEKFRPHATPTIDESLRAINPLCLAIVPNINSLVNAVHTPITARVPLTNVNKTTASPPLDATCLPDTIRIPDATRIPLPNVTETFATRIPDATGVPDGPNPSTLPTNDASQPNVNLVDENYERRMADVESALRNHVIATMPIRLILVNPTQPTSDLTLIERDDVVEHIMDSMKKKGVDGNFNDVMEIAKKKARFGILSHTWGKGELKYKDLVELRPNSKIMHAPGYVKLEKFCAVLRPSGIEFGWADTVCIDKSSSTELDESIRSMFKWYENGDICIAYLGQTTSVANMGDDKWFTRGWTLQELLAPRKLKYYGKNWRPLTQLENDKEQFPPDDEQQQLDEIQEAVAVAAKLPRHETYGGLSSISTSSYGVAERMSWMARRVTTREEDMSYALMGLLGVSMSPAYGEGAQRAFLRLYKELLATSYSPDLFNWASNPISNHIHHSFMLPSSPKCFLPYVKLYEDLEINSGTEPPLLTSVGLRMRLLLLNVIQDDSGAWDYEDDSDGGFLLRLKHGIPTEDEDKDGLLVHVLGGDYHGYYTLHDGTELALGLINYTNDTYPIPSTCLMVVLYKDEESTVWKRFATKEVVSFEVSNEFYVRATTKGLKDDGIAIGFETIYL